MAVVEVDVVAVVGRRVVAVGRGDAVDAEVVGRVGVVAAVVVERNGAVVVDVVVCIVVEVVSAGVVAVVTGLQEQAMHPLLSSL